MNPFLQKKINQPLPYHNLYLGIILVLNRVLVDKYAINQSLENIFIENKQWGKKDRFFIREMVYEIVRWKGYLSHLLEKEYSPQYAWDFIGIYLKINKKILPDFIEFNLLKNNNLHDLIKQSVPVHNLLSYPKWMVEKLQKAYGDSALDDLSALNKGAELVIRVNTLKTSLEKLIPLLETQGYHAEKIPHAENALLIQNRPNLTNSTLYKNGFFEIQDWSSQQVAPFLDTSLNDVVIDACAGAGGKSLHLACLMQNTGKIISLDTRPIALKELTRRAKRNRAKNIQTMVARPDTMTQLFHTADKLLIDAPCSGSGTIKRQPELKWKLTLRDLEKYARKQAQLLHDYSNFLKPNGILVYATCSIMPEENEEQIAHFCASHPEFKLVEELRLSPAKYGFDGFYMAKLKKHKKTH